jgi:NAD(P)-dependent dehydrogenase (short-subunit alcohol dehydrogenase family)
MSGPETKVAFITGGGRGIGLAIAGRLAKDGYRIAIFDRDPGELTEGWLALPGDVTDQTSVQKAVADCETSFGPISLLVNNAGICPIAPLVETSLEDFQATFRVNVEGAFICMRTVLPGMIARERGSVINLSSWIGKNGQAYYSAYAATKAALIGLTQAVSGEVARYGIRVNAICPGIVDQTNMRASIDAAQAKLGLPPLEQRLKSIPMGRAAEPDDVVGLVAFLASDEARYITGEALGVTGGIR